MNKNKWVDDYNDDIKCAYRPKPKSRRSSRRTIRNEVDS